MRDPATKIALWQRIRAEGPLKWKRELPEYKRGTKSFVTRLPLVSGPESDKEKNSISLTLFYVEDVHFGFAVSRGNNSLPHIINPNLSQTEPHTANSERGREVCQRKEIRSPGKTKPNSLKSRESTKKPLDMTSHPTQNPRSRLSLVLSHTEVWPTLQPLENKERNQQVTAVLLHRDLLPVGTSSTVPANT